MGILLQQVISLPEKWNQQDPEDKCLTSNIGEFYLKWVIESCEMKMVETLKITWFWGKCFV